MRKFTLLFLAGTLLGLNNLLSQVSTGGLPPSFSSKIKSIVKSEFVPSPDLTKLQTEDVVNDRSNKPYRVAKMIDVDYCITNSGTWDTLSTGEKIWRLNLYSPDAQGLQVNFSNFNLPPGARLFVYNHEKNFVKGAFTDQNNDPSGNFAVEIIPGENCIVELAISAYTVELPRFCISQIGYVYRGIDYFLPGDSRLKAAGECQVNINCSPEVDNWKDVKRSVARIYMSGYFCSGNLVNNTSQDFKNYFTTAFHCIDGISSTSSNWIFYFNYERSGCSNSSSNISPNTITGAAIRAKTPIDGAGDGALLQLSGTIPASYNVYYAGWNRVDSAVTGGICIHHPQGDRKKISTIRNKWYNATWHGVDNEVGAEDAHWHTVFAQTPNGHGTTEGGSSGSGFFGTDELLRGTLTGGSSSCDIPSGSNLFGKLSYNWDQYGSTAASQFKTWLDPSNTGATKVRGADPNNLASFNVYWNSSSPTIEIDSTVIFTDETLGTNLTRKWTFTGGDPSSSTVANPVVKYTQSGVYDVSLEITYNGTKYTKTRTQYIFVKPKSAWVLQHTRFPLPERGIQGIGIIDSLNVWAWAYDGIDPSKQILEYCVTEDGGKTWTADSLTSDTLKLYGFGNIFPLNKDTVYASIFGPSGGGKIINTRDGGKNWEVQTSAKYNTPEGFPNFVYFFDKNNGICCGDPVNGYFEIYQTNDGGQNWTRVSSSKIPANLPNETGTTNMYDCKGDTIWFGTGAGRVYRSINKGLDWTVTSTNLTGQTTVKFRNSKVGFAIAQGDSYAVQKTADGGDTWSAYALPPYYLKGDLVYVPGTRGTWLNVSSGWPSGSSFTINDGGNFSSIDVGIQYTTVAFYNEFIGWAGSFNIDSTFGGIYKWDKHNDILTSITEDIISDKPHYEFQIFPNPVEGVCTISGNIGTSGATVYIFNIQGKCLHKFLLPNSYGRINQQLDVNDLPAGIYILQIQGLTFTENIRFIKI